MCAICLPFTAPAQHKETRLTESYDLSYLALYLPITDSMIEAAFAALCEPMQSGLSRA
jgi:hypothetical protein